MRWKKGNEKNIIEKSKFMLEQGEENKQMNRKCKEDKQQQKKLDRNYMEKAK